MRVLNRVLALLLSVAFIVAAAVYAVEVFADLFGQPTQIVNWHSLYDAGERDTWNSTGVRALLVALGILGLLLLLGQLAPRRPQRLALDPHATGVDAALSRRAVRDVLAAAAMDVDGVAGVKTAMKRHRVSLEVTTRFGASAGAQSLKPEIESVVAERLSALRLKSAPRVTTTVKAGGS